ncbi:hypothetical protein FACS1894211_14520 [Clostridia bacterium]|nr:hypothetical protein FACS1894211_14520 [Clostridia bacterium]
MVNLKRAKVNKRIPKNRFKGDLSAVELVTWLYKISLETADFRKAGDLAEIQIFEVKFKADAIDKKAFAAIQKAIPYPIIFAAGAKNYTIAEGTLFEADAIVAGDELQIERRSSLISDLYDDIIKHFVPIAKRMGENTSEFIARYSIIKGLERDIASLQKRVDTEKQPNKRIQLNEELKRLKADKEALQ